MIYTFFLSGEVVSKKNNNRFNRATGQVYKSKNFCKWHSKATAELLQQKQQKYSGEFLHGLAKTTCITFEFRHNGKARRDSDNQVTSVLDLLVECGILIDDNIFVVPKMSTENKEVDKVAMVGVKVTIEV